MVAAMVSGGKRPGPGPGPGLCFTWRRPAWSQSRHRSEAFGLRPIRRPPGGGVSPLRGLSDALATAFWATHLISQRNI